MDEWKVALTEERSLRMCPSLTGARKISESTDAVTTLVRLCRTAAMAAALSIKVMTRPPQT